MKPTLVRSSNGVIAGVCQGVAEKFEIEVLIVRILWILSIFCLGTGVVGYIILAVSLPRADELEKGNEPKILGVCKALAPKLNIELGILRVIACLGLLVSFGSVVFVYVLLHLLLPKLQAPDAPSHLKNPSQYNPNNQNSDDGN